MYLKILFCFGIFVVVKMRIDNYVEIFFIVFFKEEFFSWLEKVVLVIIILGVVFLGYIILSLFFRLYEIM